MLQPPLRLSRTTVFLHASFAALLALSALPALSQDARTLIERDGGLNHGAFEPKEWQEAEAPPPPEFDIRRLLPLEMPHYMSLRFGVDPKTMSVTGDGVVRYVVVAHRENPDVAVNAFYEGVRCATGEYKTYARYSGNQWDAVATPEWKRIEERNSIYTYQLVRQSLCVGRAPRPTVADMVRELKQPEIQRN